MPHGKSAKIFDLVKEYLQSERYRSLSYSSKRNYLSAIRIYEHLILADNKYFFNHRVNQINYGTVDYLHRVMSHEYSPATIKSHFIIMGNVWEVAIRNGRCWHNPWNSPRIKLHNDRDITWSSEQIALTVRTAKELGFHTLALYVSLCYETAQRPWKDLRDLKWSNIVKDERGKYIFDIIISKTKTHLLIPLSGKAIELLNNTPRISEYVFVNAFGLRLTQQGISKQFNIVKDKAMLPKILQIRDIRRSVITEMAMSGATSLEIEAATGWRCTEAVIHRYARLRLVTAQHAMEKRNKFREELEDSKRAINTDELSELPRV